MASGSGGSLLTFLARRLLIAVLLLFLISLGVYSLILILPGNPAITLAGGTHASPGQIAKITRSSISTTGFFVQYWNWLKGALHGNLGNSLFNNETVASGIAARFPVTLSIAAGGMIVAILLGVPSGVIAGLHQGAARDRVVTVGSSLAVAIPDFWLGMLLVIVFAVKLGWLPALGYTPFTQSPAGWFEDLLLPWLALGIGGSAVIARQVRGALIDTLDQDYMRTAVAKGLGPRMVVGKHALKNALEPGRHGHRDPVRLPARAARSSLSRSSRCRGSAPTSSRPSTTRTSRRSKGWCWWWRPCFVLINLVVDVIYAYLNPKIRLS